jgi:hypothetical protein
VTKPKSMTSTRMAKKAAGKLARTPLVLAIALGTLTSTRPAAAWDPATTQAGITERAVLASSFHRVLSRRLSRPLGALEPLQLHSQLFAPEERFALWERLKALDPAEGYRPNSEGQATALAWVTAGAVLAETPAERGRNHFFDPRDGSGLHDDPGLSGASHALRLALDAGGSLRGLATGTTFDITGKPALHWVLSPNNDQSLGVFHDHLAAAVSAAEPAQRESALVRALIAMGGILAALEDTGEPAHVRNDFRAAFLQRQSASGWDRASSFERFTAARYGRVGVPAPAQAVRRPTLESFFSAPDGGGLADRTQRRFFSDGTVPADVVLDADSSPQHVLSEVGRSLEYPQPTVDKLELHRPGTHYVTEEGRRILAYERLPRRLHFFVDQAVYADAARALLPEVGAFATGLCDHLLRAGFTLAADGQRVRVTLEGVQGSVEGTLQLFVEDRDGRRRPLVVPAPAALAAGELLTVAIPPGTRRVAALLRGKDGGGALVAVGELTLP